MKPKSSLKKSLTKAPAERVVKDIRRATRRHFSEEELVKLTVAVAMINTWNRLSVAFHKLHPLRRAEAA